MANENGALGLPIGTVRAVLAWASIGAFTVLTFLHPVEMMLGAYIAIVTGMVTYYFAKGGSDNAAKKPPP